MLCNETPSSNCEQIKPTKLATKVAVSHFIFHLGQEGLQQVARPRIDSDREDNRTSAPVLSETVCPQHKRFRGASLDVPEVSNLKIEEVKPLSEKSDVSHEHILGGNSHTSGDSTSEDTLSINKSLNSSPEAIACQPLLEKIEVSKSKYQTFLIDSVAGLSGNEKLREYPCLLNEENSKFFVLLGDTEFSLFSKSTFMNLCNFAEKNGASSVVLLLDREHAQKSQYRRMFKVIDAERLCKDEAEALLAEGKKSCVQETTFYEVELI